jgi:DNA invertase Pin-like site-specific DNA recombinase
MKVESMNELKHPGGRPRRPVNLAEAGRLLAEGHSLRQTARRMGLGYGTLYRAAQVVERDPKLIQNSARRIV